MPFHLLPAGAPATRREFLAGLALGAASLSACRGQDEAPWFALVSDTHIATDRRQEAFGQVPGANFQKVVADILAAPRRPEGILINGDLALKDGKAGDYETFLALLDPLRAAGLPVHLTLGNHDDRTHFLSAIRGKIPAELRVEDKYVGTLETLGRRFVLLDSLDKVNVTPGLLGPTQLEWLGAELDRGKDRPTIVFVHHPPHSTPGAPRPDALIDGDALLRVLKARPWVEALVYGHFHRWVMTREDGLVMVNLPATAYAFTPGQPLGYCRLDIANGRPRFTLRDAVRKA